MDKAQAVVDVAIGGLQRHQNHPLPAYATEVEKEKHRAGTFVLRRVVHGQMTLAQQIIAISEMEEKCLRKTLRFRHVNRVVWERAEILKLFDAMMEQR